MVANEGRENEKRKGWGRCSEIVSAIEVYAKCFVYSAKTNAICRHGVKGG